MFYQLVKEFDNSQDSIGGSSIEVIREQKRKAQTRQVIQLQSIATLAVCVRGRYPILRLYNLNSRCKLIAYQNITIISLFNSFVVKYVFIDAIKSIQALIVASFLLSSLSTLDIGSLFSLLSSLLSKLITIRLQSSSSL